MARVEMELRNLPRFRVIEYLIAAGGALTGPRSVAGPDWTATLTPMPPAQVGSITVPRDCLAITGADDAVVRVHAFMRQKTMRGGG